MYRPKEKGSQLFSFDRYIMFNLSLFKYTKTRLNLNSHISWKNLNSL